MSAYTGPCGGLTAVPHRAQPVTSSEPGINYIDSDEDSEDSTPADGTSLAARLARLHYPRQRLAGNLTLPTWVPLSPPVPYERWYRIRQGDLARCKAQTLPARRCFSDHRLDDEDEMLQTMMTSLCSTNSDSLPNLGGPAVGGRNAASMDELGPSSLEEFGPVSLDGDVRDLGEVVTPTAEPRSEPGSPTGLRAGQRRTVNGAGSLEGSISPSRVGDCPTPTNTTETQPHPQQPFPKLSPSGVPRPNGLCRLDAAGNGRVENSASQLEDAGLGSSVGNVHGLTLNSPGRIGSFVSWDRGEEVDSGCVTGDMSGLAEAGDLSAERIGDEGRDRVAAGCEGEVEVRQEAVSCQEKGAEVSRRTASPLQSTVDPTSVRPLPAHKAFSSPGSPVAPAATSTPIHTAPVPVPAATSTPPRPRRREDTEADSGSDADSAAGQQPADSASSRLPPYHRYTKAGKTCTQVG